jgi:hypothetical protein
VLHRRQKQKRPRDRQMMRGGQIEVRAETLHS